MIRATLLTAIALLCGACSLDNDLEVALEPYTAQPVVEAYLTPGQPFRVLLTRSADLLAPSPASDEELVANTLLSGAEVRVRFGNEEVVLAQAFSTDSLTGQLFNYTATERVPANYTDSFYLEIDLPDGSGVRAAAQIQPAVPVARQEVAWGVRDDSDVPRASLTTYLIDPDVGRVNHFRKIVKRDLRDSSVLQGFVFNDALADQALLSSGTDFEFAEGDSVFVLVAHIDGDYERFVTGLTTAVYSISNPLAQPSPLLGNVRGVGGAEPIGVFTGYDYVLERIIIPPR